VTKPLLLEWQIAVLESDLDLTAKAVALAIHTFMGSKNGAPPRQPGGSTSMRGGHEPRKNSGSANHGYGSSVRVTARPLQTRSPRNGQTTAQPRARVLRFHARRTRARTVRNGPALESFPSHSTLPAGAYRAGSSPWGADASRNHETQHERTPLFDHTGIGSECESGGLADRHARLRSVAPRAHGADTGGGGRRSTSPQPSRL
jgi:hypothetical protein